MTTEVALPTRRAGASPRHLLSAEDLDGLGLARLLDRAASSCAAIAPRSAPTRPLAGRQVALLFEKPSLRTRVSFEVAVTSLGGHAIALGPDEVGLGRAGERGRRGAQPVAPGRRHRPTTFAHDTLVEMAEAASVPVINALTDAEHPCQALADLITLRQRFGRLAGVRLAYVGDGNNVAHSLMLAGALAGLDVRVATPPGYAPDPDVLARARALATRHRSRVSVGTDPVEAVTGADAVYTDVWTSMGREAEAEERRARFAGFEVNESLLTHAAPHVVALHCMPAHRGEEISAAVLDGPRSLALEQAENRRYVQEAVLIELIGSR